MDPRLHTRKVQGSLVGKKKLVIEIIFDEITEEYTDPEDNYTYLEVKEIRRGKKTTLTEGEMDSLGEEVGQSDRWQVDRWIDIQEVLGGRKSVKVKK